ncbi:hypothetical protein SDC9_142526 [bioreactor metagenome]|uniref:Uncharacterized protein n=1 Tax=bioreactor metagenome TaxID=1076179 RepID=A0A645E478_9ZZZZ
MLEDKYAAFRRGELSANRNRHPAAEVTLRLDIHAILRAAKQLRLKELRNRHRVKHVCMIPVSLARIAAIEIHELVSKPRNPPAIL